jgi:hypothetical protein
MKVLIIEDSEYKIQSLQGFLKDLGLDKALVVAKSFQTGKRSLMEYRPDLVFLDMTIMTSENEFGQLEGRNRMYGGKELLAEMQYLGLTPKVIIVTQYDHFGEPPNVIDVSTVFQQLKTKFPDIFQGGVFYSNVDLSWQSNLRKLLKKLALI